ncbi:MAG: GH32 C-terminal domain-containing protein, partial [Exiguobacterium sp.]|nr:GH32 C-terminal domain-containing protein [Exiguobacterium sp.]MDX5425296.1 GH32 C-terminal domain-containing protein [Exiguobacterium sp.]MDX6772714.1 GH32 C-terminal domain-containing protein [Exiguobacterium sp.]
GDAATFSKRGDVIELSRDGDTRRIQADGRTFRIFFDASSIEIFVNDGEYVFSSRVYPTQRATHSISGVVEHLTLYKLETNI